MFNEQHLLTLQVSLLSRLIHLTSLLNKIIYLFICCSIVVFVVSWFSGGIPVFNIDSEKQNKAS